MAKIIGFDPTVLKRFTCQECSAIVEYAPNEEKYADWTDDGTKVKGLNCPNCKCFHRTNS